MLVRRHLEIRIINPVLSDIFSRFIARNDFFEEDALQYLNVKIDGKVYAIYYSGDTENRPYISIPDALYDVNLLVYDWLLLDAYTSNGSPIRENPVDDIEGYNYMSGDLNHGELREYLDQHRDEIEEQYLYVFAEGYVTDLDHSSYGLFWHKERGLGHNVFEYDASKGEEHYITEPVTKESPYYIGEGGSPGFITLKISNPEWKFLRLNKALSTLFENGFNTGEIDPLSRGGRYAYDFVIHDVPVDSAYCPQNIWDFTSLFKRLIKEKGLKYSVQEQEESHTKGNKHILELDRFWDGYNESVIEFEHRHIIWETRDE